MCAMRGKAIPILTVSGSGGESHLQTAVSEIKNSVCAARFFLSVPRNLLSLPPRSLAPPPPPVPAVSDAALRFEGLKDLSFSLLQNRRLCRLPECPLSELTLGSINSSEVQEPISPKIHTSHFTY